MFVLFIVLLVFSTCAPSIFADDPSLNRFRGHITKSNGKYQISASLEKSYIEPRASDNLLADGFWDQGYNTTGWSILEIRTSSNQSDVEQVYSAGLLEGRLTRDLIDMQWQNSISDVCANQTFCGYLSEFLQIQLQWIYSKIRTYPNDEYWYQVNLLLVQLNGLIDGHANKPRGPRNVIDDPLGFFLFQIVESIGDIAARFNVPNVARHDSCSALIKILPDNSDIFVSHADWSNYRTMLKILKRYIFPLKRSGNAGSPIIPGAEMVFSSYPGTLHSIDDFYMTREAQMTVIETTIVNYNPNLSHNIIPISVPEWIRIVVSNRLSNSGQEWIEHFFLFNDGTYNNEWMIVDYKKFTPGQLPADGFLMVAEQMVTDYEYEDMTPTLRNQSYWASYNNVYFPRFRDISGEDKMAKEKGPELYSWNSSSRARIFARDHVKVLNLTSMLHMMRYNNFEHDPLSVCNCTPQYSAELTIAARCDLNWINGTYPEAVLGHRVHGATDAKIASYAMMKNFTLMAVAGPTTDDQPPFVWSKSDFGATVSHVGHPDVWNFEAITPTWMIN